GILGNGLFGAGMRAAQERENNILRRYKVAPITPLPLLVASIVTGLVVYMPYIVLMLGISHFRYGMAFPPNLGTILVFIALGVIAIRSLGLIIASVVNSMQESGILVQIVYMAMLFLSGTTFPTSMFPDWLLTVTQFIPATWLVTGLQGIILRQETLAANWQAVGALIVTAFVGLLLCVKLFRWEKEEKMRPAAKLWVLAVLLPFVLLGTWQTHSKDNVRKSKVLERQLDRSRTTLIRNARIFIGNGKVIENGAVLVKDGKIAEVYDGNIPDPKDLNASTTEAAGKTILPGLIDTHVHLGAPGGMMEDWKDYDATQAARRELAAYLYSGITSVRSLGDPLDAMLKVRATVNSGENLGAELFVAGPLFTTPGGHGTEYFRAIPENMRLRAEAQFLRMPKTANEAKRDVDSLKASGVDAIKGILESGTAGALYNRLDPSILDAIGAAARANKLPFAVHTADAKDVEDALHAGASSIEHGSFRQRIPDSVFGTMAMNGVSYDPTLYVGAAFPQFAAGKLDLLNRSLVQQTAPPKLLASTRRMIESPDVIKMRKAIGDYPMDFAIARDNLLRAWKAGVSLVTGSDAGNMLVFHGPTIQYELQLWVEAGIPIPVALQAATLNAARVLGAEARMGSIEKGKEATLLVVEGNPLQDIKAVEAISFIMFKGERLNRAGLLKQE
ncbi:MAG TPA: amidohydrolase family protein, partial [Bryobacteraceae bacterium]|nr:amidohydrolase family protein [Bryobacteraceae bacterium]